MTAEDAIAALLERRRAGRTICPSEAARVLERPNGSWRDEMNAVHAAAMRLEEQGAICLTWQGVPRGSEGGPYRVARA